MAKEGHWDLGRCGGGVLLHDGLPPPSLSGLVRKPSWTRIGLSWRPILCECACVTGLSDGLGSEPDGFCPWAKSDSRRALANPCIMGHGYRLRSADDHPFGLACSAWLHRRFCQWNKGRFVATVVGLGCAVQAGTGQNVFKVSPSACSKLRSQLMAQMLEHFAADGDAEH